MERKYQDMVGRPFVQVPVIDERSKDAPLDALGTLVYGLLLYKLGSKDRQETRMARTAISRELRLDKKAVDRAVAILSDGGLVREDGHKLEAVQPSGPSERWFRYNANTTDSEWWRRFIYDRVYLPRSSTVLSVKANALFWHLVKLGQPVDRMPGYLWVEGHPNGPLKYLSATYLANGLRCYRRTVARGLARLVELGLIKIQRKNSSSIVVGIPPIGTKANLWRDSWGGGRTAGSRNVEITAESLFGVPSREMLVPSTLYDAGASRYIRAYGIRGSISEQIVTKIVKHRIEAREWQCLLDEADRIHKTNRAEDPEKYRSVHCGDLFKYMLDEYVAKRTAKTSIGSFSPWTASEMEADELLSRLRITKDARILLRYALKHEQLELRTGGCVPCRLSWDHVLDVLKRSGSNFDSFKREIAGFIFSRQDSSCGCDWLDQWMALEPIPLPNDSPMDELGLSTKAKSGLRSYAEIMARSRYDDDIVNQGHWVNNMIRLACWQAASRSEASVEDSITFHASVMKRPASSTPRQADADDHLITEAEELRLLC